MSRGAFLPALLVVLLSCNGSGPSDDKASLDLAGVPVVENASPAWPADSGWTLARKPILDLGSADAPPAYQFQVIVGAARLPDGGYVVADGRRNQLLFYDASGRSRATAGGPGAGPGEFRSIQGLTLTGDSVLVYDPLLGRLTVLGPDGAVRGTVQLAPTGNDRHSVNSCAFVGTLDGRLVMVPQLFTPRRGGKKGIYWDSAAILAYGMGGTLLGKLAEPRRMEMFTSSQGSSAVPFGRRTGVTANGSSLFETDTRTYEIHVYGGQGKLDRVIRRAWQPRPVTSADREKMIQFFVARSGMAENDPQVVSFRRMLESAPLPEHMPAVLRLIADSQGTLWAADYRLPWDTTSTRWSIFDPKGVWLGNLHTPDRFDVLAVTPDAVLGVQRDSMDVEHFQVLRINK